MVEYDFVEVESKLPVAFLNAKAKEGWRVVSHAVNSYGSMGTFTTFVLEREIVPAPKNPVGFVEEDYLSHLRKLKAQEAQKPPCVQQLPPFDQPKPRCPGEFYRRDLLAGDVRNSND